MRDGGLLGMYLELAGRRSTMILKVLSPGQSLVHCLRDVLTSVISLLVGNSTSESLLDNTQIVKSVYSFT